MGICFPCYRCTRSNGTQHVLVPRALQHRYVTTPAQSCTTDHRYNDDGDDHTVIHRTQGHWQMTGKHERTMDKPQTFVKANTRHNLLFARAIRGNSSAPFRVRFTILELEQQQDRMKTLGAPAANSRTQPRSVQPVRAHTHTRSAHASSVLERHPSF